MFLAPGLKHPEVSSQLGSILHLKALSLGVGFRLCCLAPELPPQAAHSGPGKL